MQAGITRERAEELLKEYNKGISLKTRLYRRSGHGLFCKGWASEDEEFWRIVGLLHDIDFEMYPEEHCIKAQEILREHNVSEEAVRAVASHGYAITVDIEPVHTMEKVLYAVDELTGLIGAVAIMRPSKSVRIWSLNP